MSILRWLSRSTLMPDVSAEGSSHEGRPHIMVKIGTPLATLDAIIAEVTNGHE